MPPFGRPGPSSGMPAAPRLPPLATPPRQARMSAQSDTRLPPKPRFEPIVNPAVLVVGLAGLVLLGIAALVLLGSGLP